MSEEEQLLESNIEEEIEAEDEVFTEEDQVNRKRHRIQLKNKATIENFLGNGQRANSAAILPRYYGELLTWALHKCIEKDEWKIVKTLGYSRPKPSYTDVETDYSQSVNLLIDGQLMLERGDSHFIVTVDVNLVWRTSIQIEGPSERTEEIERLIEDIKVVAREKNIYRGKKLEYTGRLRFLDLKSRSWDSIILDAETKAEIRANTTGFLDSRDMLDKYGIPPKRGILMAGEPGVGKTIICKAIMAEANRITCITTNAYALIDDGYIIELYELAQDLSPCIVFLEDIDLIGRDRVEFGYSRGGSLLSLLAILDGIEEHQGIVTVATTNHLDTLDKAISERPSRFDRVVKLTLPSLEQRREMVSLMSKKISLDETTKEYIAQRAEKCTPAQIQEIIYGLIIKHVKEITGTGEVNFGRDEIDSIIFKINGRSTHNLGFCASNGNNGHKCEKPRTLTH